jgi:hypothetical protein
MDVRLHPGWFRRVRERPVNHSQSVKTIYNAPMSPLELKPKAVAFDLDETLGSFSDLYIIWSSVRKEMKTQKTFNELMDLYPEFLRIGIIPILDFLKSKIVSGHCLPIFIYTNNQCEDSSWVERIISYLESRVSNYSTSPVQLFARPIRAFKICNARVEPNRTTHEKTYKDFIRCSMLKHTDLCFVDDASHEKMKRKRVYYIQPPPYFHILSQKEINDRLVKSDVLKAKAFDKMPDFDVAVDGGGREDRQKIKHAFAKHSQEIANKMMYYAREFFFVSIRRCVTKKCDYKIGRFSRKKRRI